MKFFERVALYALAFGFAVTVFLRVLDKGAPVLPMKTVVPLKTRLEVVERDRAFLEAAPASSINAVEGPGVRDVVGDKCTGKDCQVNSITTYNGLTLAQLPTCNASTRAMTRWATTGGADGGGTNVECNGSSWVAVGNAAGASSADTCTGPSCAIGAVGISTDGGILSLGGGFGVSVPSGTYVCLDYPTCNVRISSQTGNLVFTTTNGASKLAIDSASGRVSTNFGFTSAEDVTATTFLKSIGVASGSLPTCNAGAAGSLEYDTTLTCFRICNGTAWSVCVQPASYINNYWSTTCFGVCGEDVNMQGGIRSLGGTTNRVVCSWGTAGTGGSTGVVVKIRDVTAASNLCTCTIGACTIAAGTPTVCTCTATYTLNNIVSMQLDGTTDCAGNPSNIVCTAMVLP
jgi:hypothetical protein